ncbi:MAG: diacylglycerol kinase family protein [Phycisphaerales bacterium]
MRIVLLVNETSGRGRAAALADACEPALRAVGAEVVRLPVTVADGALAQQARGAAAVVAVGGDGTVRSTAQRILPLGVPMAVAPAGTENLVARAFGFRVPPAALAAAIASGATRRIDVAMLRRRGMPDHLFLAMLSAGFDAEVVARVQAARTGAITHATYLGPIVGTLRTWRAPMVRLCASQAPKKPLAEGTGMLVVANAPRYAMGLDPAPGANAQDGLLDAVFIPARGGVDVARWLLRRTLGRPPTPAVQARAFRVQVDPPAALQADGDPVPGGVSGEFEVLALPEALALVAV